MCPEKAPADQGNDSELAASVDARNSMGVQVGHHNTQINYSYARSVRSGGPAPPPLVTVAGEIDSPYRGLNAFDERDAAFFFGRESTIDALLERIAALSTPAILMVSGVSGSGKSSLLQAGVVPRIRTSLPGPEEAALWLSLIVTPSDDPMDELAVALSSITDLNAADLRRSLQDDPDNLRLLARQAIAAGLPGSSPTDGRNGDRAPRLLLIIDQFERLFTRCQDEAQRRAFVTALHAAATRPDGATPPACVVVVVRSDFEARCADYPGLAGAVEQRFLVRAMTERQLRMAITEPARMLGGDIDNEVVETLLSELEAGDDPQGLGSTRSRAGVLPLVSHALDQAWRVRSGSTVTLADYERTGGVEGAVAASAQRVYSSLSASQQEMARQIFTRLAVTGPDETDTADRVPRWELGKNGDADADVQAVLEAFAAQRLLVLDADTVEISHEVLLTAWPLLRDVWLAETRADRLIRSRLRNTAAEWERHGEDSSYLYSGSLLERAAEAQQRISADPRQSNLGATESAFLAVSLGAKRRRQHQRRALVASLLALTLALASATVFAWGQRASALEQRDLAIARQLIDESQSQADGDPWGARLKSLAAWQLAPPDVAEDARWAMTAAAVRPGLAKLDGHTSEVVAVAYNADGSLLASVGLSQGIQLWDVQRYERVGDLIPVSDSATTIVFSPDGMLLAYTDSAYSGEAITETIQIWDIARHRLTSTIALDQSVVSSWPLTFSSDSQTLFIRTDRSVSLWSVPAGKVIGTVPIGGEVLGLGAGGQSLASLIGADLQYWDIATRQRSSTVQLQGAVEVEFPQLSADGTVLAGFNLSDGGFVVQRWDAHTGRSLGDPLAGLQVSIEGGIGLVFRVDCSMVAVSDGNSVEVWDLPSRASLVKELAVPGEAMTALAFAPGGDRLASGGMDHSVRIRDVAVLRESRRFSFGEGNPSRFALRPPSGDLVVSGTFEGQLQFWDVAGGRPLVSVAAHDGAVSDVAFNPAVPSMLASAGLDGKVRFWNSDTKQPLMNAITYPSPVTSIAFSPRGELLAIAIGQDIVLWDVGERHSVATMSGHGMSLSGVESPHELDDTLFTPDGSMVVSAAEDNAIGLWDVKGRNQLASLGGGEGLPVSDLVVSPDGRTLVSGVSMGLGYSTQVWDIPSRSRGILLDGSVPRVPAFVGDGGVVATSGQGIELWMISTQRSVGRIPLGNEVLIGMSPFARTADGKVLAALTFWFDPSTDKSQTNIRLWNVEALLDPQATACASLGRPPDRNDWEKYVPEGPAYRELCP